MPDTVIEKVQNIRKQLFFYLNYVIILFALLLPIRPHLGKKAFLLMIFIWILSFNYKDFYNSFMKSAILKSVGLYSLFITFSLLWTENLSWGLKYLEAYSLYFFLPLVILATTIRKEFINKIISAFLLSMMINEVMSYGLFFGFMDSAFGYQMHGNSYNPLPFQSSHMVYSVYIAISIFLAIYNLFHDNNKITKIISAFFIITMTANLFLSAGRTGQVLFILSTLLLITIYFRKQIKIIFYFLGLLTLILSVAYHLSDTFQDRVVSAKNDLVKVINHGNYNSSWGARLAYYTILPDLMIENNVLIGTGVGDINDVVLKKATDTFGANSDFSTHRGYMHSTFLEITVAYGLIGLFLFCVIIYQLMKLKISSNQVRYLRYLIFCIICFASLSNNIVGIREFMYLLALLIPLVIVGGEDQDNELFLK